MLRLKQIFNAVFVPNTGETTKLLAKVKQFVVYGTPSRKHITQLLKKRGFISVANKKTPLDNNAVVEDIFGEKGILCVDDIAHEFATNSQHIKAINERLWYKARDIKCLGASNWRTART